jgi:hypothetical protein
MHIFQKFFNFSQEKAFLPKRLVLFQRPVEKKGEGEEVRLSPDEAAKGKEKELASLKANVGMQALREQALSLEGVENLKDEVKPKTDFVSVILFLINAYLKWKNPPDATGRTETWRDVETLADDMFKGASKKETPAQRKERVKQELDKMLVDHKCNTPRELESAISKNRGIEFDVVWDSITNQFVVQHNSVSRDQKSLFTCKDAYKIMREKGASWGGGKCVLDLKDHLGMRINRNSEKFKERAYQRVDSLLNGMPKNFINKLHLSTFDPYTIAIIQAYREMAKEKGKAIQVVWGAMSLMGYGATSGTVGSALDVVQVNSSGIIGAFQGATGGLGDLTNDAIHALPDTKIHTGYKKCWKNLELGVNNIVAAVDPIKDRVRHAGDGKLEAGIEKMKELTKAGLRVSVNGDLVYLQHIIDNLDSEGRYHGVRPEHIVVYGVKDANTLHDVFQIASKGGHRWAMVIHDVQEERRGEERRAASREEMF